MTQGLDSRDESSAVAAWLREAVRAEASDLHVVAGLPPTLRIHGKLCPLDQPAVDAESVESQLMPLCSPVTAERLADQLNIDFSLQTEIEGQLHRFRANYFYSGQSLGACFRLIPERIPSLDWANFPITVADRMAHFRNGLVIVSGVTGSGKSTTLAMIINMLNREGNKRIVTVEEPVEYRFPLAPGSVMTQREVGLDVHSFLDGLKYGLRQDTDVMLVGEIRDPETARMALTAAETGLLVFTTLHARDVKGVISRYTDLYPSNAQDEVRGQLADSLRAVVCQHLLPPSVGDKRELALEIMFNNSPMASGIRQGKLQSIDNSILTGRDDGMLTLDESLRRLLRDGRITRDTAARFASDPSRMS
jgi:twitching motility protein PilT